MIVKHIEKKINLELHNSYCETKQITGEPMIYKNFAKKFGKLLLPDESFGTAGSSRSGRGNGGRGGGGSIRTNKSTTIDFVERKFEENGIILEYKITIKNKVREITAINYINSINGSIDPTIYEESMLTYPCSIHVMFAQTISYNSKTIFEAPKILKNGDAIRDYRISYLLTKSNKVYGFRIVNNIDNPKQITFVLRLKILTDDPLVSTYLDFDIEEGKHE